MGFLTIKEFYITFIKRGKISPHRTVSKGKEYLRSKIYLGNSKNIGLRYELYEAENIHLVTEKRHRKGKGYIVFIPT